MPTATLSRGSTSVSFDVVAPGQGLAIARDIGKPTAGFKAVGHQDPRSVDISSANDVFTVFGRLQGTAAYDDAQTLAETLIKGSLGSNKLTLDLSNFPGRSVYEVAPASANAAELSYNPGVRNQVGLKLQVSAVSGSVGVSQTTQSYGAPDSGDGVKIDRGGTSLTLTSDLQVVRSVGRPKIQLQPQPTTLPLAVDQNKPASDVFEISAELRGANAEGDAKKLEELIVRERLAQNSLDLHFLGNEFSLDKYPVVPEGSQALRTVARTAETDSIGIETFNLRVVNQ